MTQDRFLRYLNNPDLLATISYEELKTLALTYPYAHNLRYLLAIKSGLDERHPDYDRNLATASAYSLDRTRLFTLLAPKKLAPAKMEQEEVVLELRPIETVQRELEARMPLAKSENQAISNQVELTADLPRAETRRPEADELPIVPETTLPTRISIENNQAEGDATHAILQMVDKTSDARSHAVFPKEKSFSAWLSQFQPPALEAPVAETGRPEDAPMEKSSLHQPAPVLKTAPEATDNKAGSPQAFAERSVTESKTIVSETLAKLYVQQGYLDKAIDMYERLGLAFPDKSAFFAAEIEKLKK